MAKKSKKKSSPKKSTKAPKRPKALRAAKAPKTRTVKATAAKVNNGAVTKAVNNFADSLGTMKIDEDMAVSQLTELGTLLEDVATAKAKSDEKAADAKTAKGTYDSKVNLFLEKAREFTHPKALPLFDAITREADLVDMTQLDPTVVEQAARVIDKNEPPF